MQDFDTEICKKMPIGRRNHVYACEVEITFSYRSLDLDWIQLAWERSIILRVSGREFQVSVLQCTKCRQNPFRHNRNSDKRTVSEQ